MKLLTLDGSYMWVHFVLLSILYMLKNFHNKLRVSQNLKLLLCWFKHSMWIWRIGNVHQLGRQNTQIPPHLVLCQKGELTIFSDIDKSHKPNMEQNKWYTRAYTLWFHLYKLQNTKIRGLKVWIVVLRGVVTRTVIHKRLFIAQADSICGISLSYILITCVCLCIHVIFQ